MGAGFAAIAVWMYLTLYGAEGIAMENEGYVAALVTALDQGAGDENAADQQATGEIPSSGQALIESLRRSLEESGVKVGSEAPAQPETPAADSGSITVERLQAEGEKLVGQPVQLERTPSTVARSAPHRGDHSAEVLGELGVEPAELQRLKALGVT